MARWSFGELRITSEASSPCLRRIITSPASMPKIAMFSAPTWSRISMLAPSSVPMVSAPFSDELHVAGAGGFHAGGRDLLGEVGGGNDHLGEADIVVGQEHDLELAADRGIVVDDLRDVVDQLDDQLGVAVARRRLAGEDLYPRHPVAVGIVLDRLVQRDRLDDVEQLALVFVDALDLHVEQRGRIDLDAEPLADQARQRRLVVKLDGAELLLEFDVAGAGFDQAELRRIVEHGFAAGLAQQIGQLRIRQHQPAAEGDAVGLVGDAAGIEMVEIVKHGLAHQVRMHRRDAVDAVRADEGELAHAHAAAALLVDQRDRGAEVDVAGAARLGEREMLRR